MAKYIANPVEVDAWKITHVLQMHHSPRKCGQELRLEDGRTVMVAPELICRMSPKVGDYYVVQADGYVYLNPAAVFERKYSPAPLNALELGAAVRKAGLQGS